MTHLALPKGVEPGGVVRRGDHPVGSAAVRKSDGRGQAPLIDTESDRNDEKEG